MNTNPDHPNVAEVLSSRRTDENTYMIRNTVPTEVMFPLSLEDQGAASDGSKLFSVCGTTVWQVNNARLPAAVSLTTTLLLYPPPSTDGGRDSSCHWQMHSWCCSVSGFLVPSLYRVLQCVFSDISRYIKNITFTLGGLHSVYLSPPSFDFVLISVQYTFLLKPWELTAVNI